MPVDPRYRDLTARVEAFVARVAQRHPDDLHCAAGCDGCCRTRLTITAVEADAIEAWAATQPPSTTATIAAAARAATDVTRCAALDDAGRCRIYPARPLVCRSHGVPVRLRDARGLPVITSCELNFTARGPAAADADCVLDQELVSTTLGLIDRAAASAAAPTATSATDRPRRALADVLVGLAPPVTS